MHYEVSKKTFCYSNIVVEVIDTHDAENLKEERPITDSTAERETLGVPSNLSTTHSSSVESLYL